MIRHFAPDFKVETDQMRLHLEKGTAEAGILRRDEAGTAIVLPAAFTFRSLRCQAWLRLVVAGQLREAARRRLPARTRELAAAYGFRYFNRITVKDVSTRWGSCSSLGNINLSLWLMLLPSRYSDYVVKHELAHLDEMNHGARFWARLDAMTDGQARQLRHELKEYYLAHYGRYR